MHIIFGHVLPWQVPIMKILKYFNLNVFYLHIDSKTEIKKNKIAIKLKKNNIYPLPRSDYLLFYKSREVPEEILEAKKNGKKILIILGYQAPINWFESHSSVAANWSSQISFMEDIIKLSEYLKDTFIVVRYKSINWINNSHFKKILKKINDSKNITISTNYKESFYSYKLCANADLVIAKHTSLVDECLVNEIPVLVYEYGHNLTKIMSGVFNYLSSELMCHNFQELLEKSKSLLHNNSSELKKEIIELNKKIYFVKEKGNVKKKLINNLENLINNI